MRAPGLVFWGTGDTTCPVEFAEELASDTGAGPVLKLNAGHWTVVERCGEIAQALERHWASVDNTTQKGKEIHNEHSGTE